MNNQLITQSDNARLISVLQTSLYPGAKPESIEMAVAYCKAAGYDIMLKPVHIVPMPVNTGRKKANGYDETEYRDVIMPGIGLYRIQAARTGQFAGMSEVEFGPQREFAGVLHPEWAKCTVKRQLTSGLIAEFTAKEFWCENYASKKDGGANAMWSKRAYGQLSKCTQAQALRMAFPEIGAHPTFEEMEGKEQERYTPDDAPAKVVSVVAVTAESRLCDSAHFENMLVTAWAPAIESGKKTAAAIIKSLSTKYDLTLEQKLKLELLEPVDAEIAEHVDASL